MVYTPKDWQDAPSTSTPITAAELERIEAGVVEGLRDASEVQTGNVELASAAEMTAGTDTTRVPSVKRVADFVAAAISGITPGTPTPPITFAATAISMIPLKLQGYAGQTADLLRFVDSANVALSAVEKNGDIRSGADASMVGMFKALCRTAATPGMTLRAALNQTAKVFEVQNNGGSVVSSIDVNGTVNGKNVGTIPGTSVTFIPMIVLSNSGTVPTGTPSGTVIMRRPA